MKRKTIKTEDDLSVLAANERTEKVKLSLLSMQSEMDKMGHECEPLTNVIFRNRLSVNLILWASILGTVLLLSASIKYLMIPYPSSYATTQTGKNIQIYPIKVE